MPYMNTRLNITAIKPIEYFSKTVIKEDIDESTPVNVPDAISPNGDGFNDVYEVGETFAHRCGAL
jgi:hypothetical protein